MNLRLQLQITCDVEPRANATRHGAELPPLLGRRQIVAMRGKYESGIPNIVENHDLYVDPEYQP